MGIFEAEQSGAGEVDIIGFDFGRDLVQRQGAVGRGIDWLRLNAAQHRCATGFVQVIMCPLADDILFAALAVAEQGHEVGLGACRQEQGGLFAAQFGGITLKFVNGGVVTVDVVPDRCFQHLLEHGLRRASNGITA